MKQTSLAIFTLILGGWTSIAAQSFSCTAATFKGAYGLLGNGFDISALPMLGAEAGIGTFVADGQGKILAFKKIVNRPNGQTALDDFSALTFTYSINADCSGRVSATIPVGGSPKQFEMAFVLVNGGREGWVMNTQSPGTPPGTVNSIALAPFKRIDDFDAQREQKIEALAAEVAELKALIRSIGFRLGVLSQP